MRTAALAGVLLLATVSVSACDHAPARPAAGPTASASDSSGCVGDQLRALALIDDQGKIQSALCREGFAYIEFGGPGVGVHGTQDAFFAWTDGMWKSIAYGETSHGAFIYEELDAETPDARRLATLFPEAGMTVPPDEPGLSVSIEFTGIGDLTLGMTETQARAASPFPLKAGVVPVGRCTTLITDDDGVPAIAVWLKPDGTVFAVSVTDGAQTAEGIHAGLTQAKLEAAYGTALRSAGPGLLYRVDGALIMSFHLMNKIISRIDVGRFTHADPAAECR